MSKLLERVGQSIIARKLFPRGEKILVAVSGGVDSMVLLHLLHELAPEQGWRLAVAHFNHQLRGRSSDADERLVRATARNLGLSFVAGRGDVRAVASAKKISTEMAARQLRHEFLARTARRQKIARVALAHHAGDQVELFFLRLLRGSGGEGLAGMKWISHSPVDAKLKLVRPLLDVSKAELEKFARENKIRFREDASNVSLDFLRNRIRGELLPLLRKYYQPALDKTILRVMEIVGSEAELVGRIADGWLKPEGRVTRVPKKYLGLAKPVLPKNTFSVLPVALQRRTVQSQLLALGIAPEFDLIERLRNEPEQVFQINPKVRIWRDAAGEVRVGKCPVGRVTPCAPVFGYERTAGGGLPALPDAVEKVDLRKSGAADFSGTKISWKIERQRVFRRPKPVAGHELFDTDKVGGKIVLRHWQAGDRFQPIGMKAAVKLQDLFVNAKIPAVRRRKLVVATTAGGEIFWVEGLRMGEKFKLSAGTKRQLCWEWRKVGNTFGCGMDGCMV